MHEIYLKFLEYYLKYVIHKYWGGGVTPPPNPPGRYGPGDRSQTTWSQKRWLTLISLCLLIV